MAAGSRLEHHDALLVANEQVEGQERILLAGRGVVIQGQLATAIGRYKAALDLAFRQITGTVGDLDAEGQYFRDEVKSDQFKVYASIAQAAVGTLVAGWNELDTHAPHWCLEHDGSSADAGR
jgi:hypothetical protein